MAALRGIHPYLLHPYFPVANLRKNEIGSALRKTGRFLSKTESVGVGAFSPLPSYGSATYWSAANGSLRNGGVRKSEEI